jgi:hypothetical protein
VPRIAFADEFYGHLILSVGLAAAFACAAQLHGRVRKQREARQHVGRPTVHVGKGVEVGLDPKTEGNDLCQPFTNPKASISSSSNTVFAFVQASKKGKELRKQACSNDTDAQVHG